jgi:hypothetical protein
MCNFVLVKCCELKVCNSYCSVAEDSVFCHVTLCCWASGSMLHGYSGTNTAISVYHLLEGMHLLGLSERKVSVSGLLSWTQRTFRLSVWGAIWNFGKDTGLS